ncbi:MAG: type I DNA topoisomerase [Candidatus Pacebacteria bacterium]|nr:type I DNA topoisomerase [Candidatus Paceibacterota bacterium]
MTKLLIVESPAKAKTITKYLDDTYTVTASVGHIRDLPKSNKKAVDIEHGFVPHYEISKGKEKVISEIKSLAKKAEEVLLATDPDREGEAIAWHIIQACDLENQKLKVKRIVFHEITKDAVNEALKHPRDIDNDLKEAQEARRVLDRLVGYDLSGLIWKKVRYGLSAGRVQSPALRILSEREREIAAFIPQKYWVIDADTETDKKEKITFTCAKEPTEEKEAEEILKRGKEAQWKIVDVKETKGKRAPKAPFITSTLQQAASSRLGFSPSRAMMLAQKLYEAGFITYMRTDSTTISGSIATHIAEVIKKEFGEKLYTPRVYKTKSKNAQEAHEAIRPTDVLKRFAGHNDAEKALYQLIWERTVASQMADAIVLKTRVIAEGGKENPEFTANGSRIISPGWLLADPRARGEDVELPKVQAQDNLSLLKIRSEEKETLPPPRYSEAGLVKELEKRGIGRPSTYAAIIKTIQERGYVEKINRSLKVTDTGEVVSSFLENNFAKYVSDTFTAEMENKLDAIADGQATYTKILEDFYAPFAKDVESKQDTEKITTLGDAEPHHKCPLCGGDMIIKLGRTGKFLSCKKFPECKGARTLEGEAMEGPKETGENCPECAKSLPVEKQGKLVERMGRFGKFIACSRYPKCKYVRKDPAQEEKAKTGVKCPECAKSLPADKQGEIMERRGRFGPFFSCSNYPDCRFNIKSKPTGKLCEDCGSLMMEGTKTIPERCSNKNCPNHNPHKKIK